MAETDYIVLKFPAPPSQNAASSTVDGLKEIGSFAASTSEAAIQRAAVTNGGGRYVAVPARSWQPRTVEVQTTTKAVLAP